jgi:putative ABC transport system substrate-binding protein
MKRREFVTGAGAVAIAGVAALPRPAVAQLKMPIIGVLLVGNREPFDSEFRAGLRDLGYDDGRNIRLEYRSAGGKLAALPDLAAELVHVNVDVLVASETPAVVAAKRATTTIPVVMAPAGDPLGTGLVGSLARPGGNVTGLSAATAELAGKSLELIREVLPDIPVIAALADPSNPFSKSFLREINQTARGLGVDILTVNVTSPD